MLPESPEDRLKRLASEAKEVKDLEQQLDGYKKNNELRLAAGQEITPTRQAEGQELRNKLDEARQRVYFSLLGSISESSAHMERATRNLQQSSESQLQVARAQSRAVDDLLNSSHRLEQFTIFLLVIGAINVFIIEETTGLLNGPLRDFAIVAFVVAIVGLTWIAFRWVRAIRKNPSILIP